MGQLVTSSRFLMSSSYSSRTRSTSSEGSMPLFEEKPWAVHCQTRTLVGMPMALVRSGTRR
jgi:hypothetical protein